jgi:uncharacterized repeat protein (TIGR01451 family)
MKARIAALNLPRRTPHLVFIIAMAVLLFAAPFLRAVGTAPTLLTAGSYAVLAGDSITNVPTSFVNGDLGLAPGSAVDGGIVVSGATNIANSAAVQAMSDARAAYDLLDSNTSTPCDFTYTGDFNLNGSNLVPGVHCSSSSFSISVGGTLTLNGGGNPDAVWIFKTSASTLVTFPSSHVVFTDGIGSSCNVFWKVGSAATIGTDTAFVGTILAHDDIQLQSRATVDGRAFAAMQANSAGALTLDQNTITPSSCSNGTTSGLSLTKAASPTTFTAVGQVIVYTYVVTNTGTTTLTGPFTVTDDKLGSFVCGSSTTILAPGDSVTCTRNHTIVASDLSLTSLPTGVTANINTGSWLAFVNSTQDTKITGAGPGVPNGTYSCWCIQDHVPTDLHNQPATLYSTTGGSLPAVLPNPSVWNKVNYTLNHKIQGAGQSNLAFLKDVQTAIWVAVGEQHPEFGVSATAQQMVNEANAHSSFVPGPDDVTAVIVYSDGILPLPQIRRGEIQESICEMKGKLKSIVNKATASNGSVTSAQVQVTVKQVR